MSISVQSLLDGSVEIVAHVHARIPRMFHFPFSTQDYWVLMFPENGSIRYKIGDDEGEAAFGDLLLCPPEVTLHRYAAEPLRFHSFEFYWRTADGGPVDPRHIPFQGKIRPNGARPLAAILPALERLDDPQLQEQLYWKHKLLRTLLESLFIDRLMDGADSLAERPSPFLSDAKKRLLEKAYGESSIETIAVSMGVTKEHFCTRFKSEAGVSPSDYVTSVRMAKARSLLLETDLNLEEIAQQCGYQSGFYLSRVFSRCCRLSPSRYRKSHRI